MIQHTIATWQDLSWQDELKSLITDPAELIQKLQLRPELLPSAQAAAQAFPLTLSEVWCISIGLAC